MIFRETAEENKKFFRSAVAAVLGLFILLGGLNSLNGATFCESKGKDSASALEVAISALEVYNSAMEDSISNVKEFTSDVEDSKYDLEDSLSAFRAGEVTVEVSRSSLDDFISAFRSFGERYISIFEDLMVAVTDSTAIKEFQSEFEDYKSTGSERTFNKIMRNVFKSLQSVGEDFDSAKEVYGLAYESCNLGSYIVSSSKDVKYFDSVLKSADLAVRYVELNDNNFRSALEDYGSVLDDYKSALEEFESALENSGD